MKTEQAVISVLDDCAQQMKEKIKDGSYGGYTDPCVKMLEAMEELYPEIYERWKIGTDLAH